MSRRRRALRPIALSLVAGGFAAAGPGRVLGHAIGDVFTLPIPLGLYLIGAGLAVAASFVVSAIVVRPPRGRPGYPVRRVPDPVVAVARPVLQALGLVVVDRGDPDRLPGRPRFAATGHPALDRHLGRPAGIGDPAGKPVAEPQPVPDALRPARGGGPPGRHRSPRRRAPLPRPTGPLARRGAPLRRGLGRADPAGPHHAADGGEPDDRLFAAHPGRHAPLRKRRLVAQRGAVRGAPRLVRPSRPPRAPRGGSRGLLRVRRGLRSWPMRRLPRVCGGRRARRAQGGAAPMVHRADRGARRRLVGRGVHPPGPGHRHL